MQLLSEFSNLKKILYLILFLLVLSPITIFSHGRYIPEYAEEDPVAEKDKIGFVEEIYSNYARMQFDFIYQNMHPEIKEILSKDDYIDFQKENFEKYHLKIEDVEINKETERVELPRKFSSLIEIADDEIVYKLEVSYTMFFTSLGNEEEEETGKEVFILEDKENLYLLWDPDLIK